MSLLEAAAGVAVLAGALLQSAVGFGFALLCAPLLFAAAGPVQAVGLLTILGLQLNVMTLLSEGRRPEPLRDLVVRLLAWSLPGMLAGVAVLRSVDAIILQVLLTLTVFATLIARWRVQRRAGEPRPAPAWAPPAAGLAAGALCLTTSTAGPAIVLLLLGRDHRPVSVRDTLTVTFLGLAILTTLVLAGTGTTGAVPGAAALAATVPLTAAGQLLGRSVFARLASGSYERVLTAVLVLSAAVGLASALL